MPSYLCSLPTIDQNLLPKAWTMDPRYLHPASAAFRLNGRSAVPPYTMNHLNAPKRNILSGSSSVTDEDGVIVYDTKKAKRIRKGAWVSNRREILICGLLTYDGN